MLILNFILFKGKFLMDNKPRKIYLVLQYVNGLGRCRNKDKMHV